MTSPAGETIIVGAVGVEVTASARRFARSLKREVTAAFRGAGQQLNKTIQDAANKRPIKLKIEPEIDQDALDRAIAGRRVKPIRLPVEPDITSAANAGRRASEAGSRAAGPIRLKADIDRASISRVVSTLGTVARTAVLGAGGLAAIAAIGQGVSAALAGIAAAAAGLIPILGQLVSVAVTAAGALAALPGALAIAGAGIGALIIGSSGLGAALKEAGQAAGGAGGAAVDMGRQIERAARGVVLAERRVADAQRDARRAQEDLNRARAEARENLEDLALSLARARLDEEAAQFALLDAERELARVREGERGSNSEDFARADLARREAAQSLAEVQERLGDVTAEEADAARKGVERADVVVAARERQRDAAVALSDAQYELAQAHLDLADAQRSAAASGGGVASAMSKLAPAARELVRTLLALKPAWDALRLDVQQTLWAGVAAEVRNLAETQLPVLREGLVGVASVLNGAMIDGLRQLATQSSQLRLAEIFVSAREALAGLSTAVAPLLRALLDLSAVGAAVVADLAGPAGEVLTRFADRISEMAASGALRQLILDGLDALKLLGSALLDIVGVFRGLFAAAGAAGGGGIFGFLERLNELINSVAGQTALTNLFAELGRIGTALMPVLLALGRGLGVVAAAIADIAVGTAPFLAEFLGLLADALASLAPGFIALGPSVVALGKALLPLGQILANLVVGLAPGVEAFLLALGEGLSFLAPAALLVGQALGELLEAVAPLLPLLGVLLATALTELSVIVAALVNGPGAAFISLAAQILTAWGSRLLPVVTRLATQLLPIFAEAGQRILAAFEPLVPLVGRIAELLASRLAAVLPRLVTVFGQLILAVADLAGPLGQALVDMLVALVPQIPQLVDSGLALAQALTDVLVALVPLLPDLTRLLTLALRLVTPTVLRSLITLLRATALGLRLMAAAAGAMLSPVRSVVGAVGRLRNAISDRFRSVVSLVRGLPRRIRNAVGNLGGILWRAGRQVLQGLIDGIRSMLPNLRSWLGYITGLIPNLKGPMERDLRLLRPSGQAIITGLNRGIEDQLPALRSTLGGATNDIAAAFATRMDPPAGLRAIPAEEPAPAPARAGLDWANALASQRPGEIAVVEVYLDGQKVQGAVKRTVRRGMRTDQSFRSDVRGRR